MELRRMRSLQKLARKWHQLKSRRTQSQYVAVNPHHAHWKFALWLSCFEPVSEEKKCCCGPPRDVPQGFLAVYVGRERKRFVIPAIYLNHPVFKLLLEKAKEEFGFSQKGGLTMPCDVMLFERFLFLIDCDDPTAEELEIKALEKYYTEKYQISLKTIAMYD